MPTPPREAGTDSARKELTCPPHGRVPAGRTFGIRSGETGKRNITGIPNVGTAQPAGFISISATDRLNDLVQLGHRLVKPTRGGGQGHPTQHGYTIVQLLEHLREHVVSGPSQENFIEAVLRLEYVDLIGRNVRLMESSNRGCEFVDFGV